MPRSVAFRKVQPGRQVSQSWTIPAPTGGWNARDNVAVMPETDAVVLQNWFPDTSDVRLRRGYEAHVTGLPDQVESLMPYSGIDGTKTLFCASDTGFYNVTSAGAVGAAVQTGLTNARWQSVNYTIGSTSYLCCFNETDSPRYWDGSSWTTITGVSSPAITGITTSDIAHAVPFKRRLYLVVKDTLSLYYLPVDAVGGAATALDLSGYFGRGGSILAAEAWTLDSGEGVDDYLAVITTEGQVAVFQGTNPASASTWTLAGIYNIGAPIGGRRCMIKYGGDCLILCNDGVIPLSTLLSQGSRNADTDRTLALTDKIRKAMLNAAEEYKANFGWNMTFYSQGQQLIINIPIREGSQQQQFVMNSITSAWCNFVDIEANCWAVLNEVLYYGGNTVVNKFGAMDIFDDDGSNIDADLKQAFSYLNAPGRQKYVKSGRPNLLVNGTPDVLMGMAVDFGDQEPEGSISFTAPTAAVWDTTTWDNGEWGGEVEASGEWQTIGANGTSVALRLKSSTSGFDIRLASTDYLFEYGNVIA